MSAITKERAFEMISSGANPLFEGDVPALLAHFVAQLANISAKINLVEMAELITVGVAVVSAE